MEHSELPPDTVGIDLVDGGVAVEYTDGREVFYRGVQERVEAPHQGALLRGRLSDIRGQTTPCRDETVRC